MKPGDRVQAKSGGHFRQVGRVFEVYGDKLGVRFDDGAEDWFSDWDVTALRPNGDDRRAEVQRIEEKSK